MYNYEYLQKINIDPHISTFEYFLLYSLIILFVPSILIIIGFSIYYYYDNIIHISDIYFGKYSRISLIITPYIIIFSLLLIFSLKLSTTFKIFIYYFIISHLFVGIILLVEQLREIIIIKINKKYINISQEEINNLISKVKSLPKNEFYKEIPRLYGNYGNCLFLKDNNYSSYEIDYLTYEFNRYSKKNNYDIKKVESIVLVKRIYGIPNEYIFGVIEVYEINRYGREKQYEDMYCGQEIFSSKIKLKENALIKHKFWNIDRQIIESLRRNDKKGINILNMQYILERLK